MTNEQAIKHLKLMQSGARNAIRYKKNDKEISEEERKEDIEIYQDQLEALEIAIKALEQQPSEDCVSRKAVTDAVENTIAKYIPTFVGQYEKIPLELARAIGDVQPIIMEINTGRRNGKTYEYYSKTMYKDKSLLEWAIIWLKTSNDAFFEEYGFNFNPHEYKGLYELAMKCRDGLHIGAVNCTQNLTTMAAQLQSGLNGLQYGV